MLLLGAGTLPSTPLHLWLVRSGHAVHRSLSRKPQSAIVYVHADHGQTTSYGAQSSYWSERLTGIVVQTDNTLQASRLRVKGRLMSFGYALRKFRESRNLSLREFSKLCDIDHAYVHRLEREEKTAPSEQVVGAFVRALKLSPRNARLLRLLVGKTVNHTLIDVFVEDEDRPLDLLEPAHQMSFRGKRPRRPWTTGAGSWIAWPASSTATMSE